jgi:hypothetical protein
LGRSLILPRRTPELKLHFAETVNFEQQRQSWKIGGDMMIEYLANFLPSQFGCEYIFDKTGLSMLLVSSCPTARRSARNSIRPTFSDLLASSNQTAPMHRGRCRLESGSRFDPLKYAIHPSIFVFQSEISPFFRLT